MANGKKRLKAMEIARKKDSEKINEDLCNERKRELPE